MGEIGVAMGPAGRRSALAQCPANEWTLSPFVAAALRRQRQFKTQAYGDIKLPLDVQPMTGHCTSSTRSVGIGYRGHTTAHW
jgi:hypothetical protein